MPATIAPSKPKDRGAVIVEAPSADAMDAAVARKLTRPEVGASAVIQSWSQGGHDVNALVTELTAQVQAVNNGDMNRAEGLLISQAHTLDAIFVNLMRRAMNQTTMPHWEAYMRMGMKAQSQCRATLQALADLKNPRPFAFVKQANIAHGHQQVNNGQASLTSTPPGAHAQEIGKRANELLGVEDGTRLDTGATLTAIGAYSSLAALDAIHRAEVSPGESPGSGKQSEARRAVGTRH